MLLAAAGFWLAVIAASWVSSASALGSLPPGFTDQVIIDRHQHTGVFPMALVFLPDNSGRYLVVDKRSRVWIGDPDEGVDLELYMFLPNTFIKDELSRAVPPPDHTVWQMGGTDVAPAQVGVVSVLPSQADDWSTNPRVYVYWACSENATHPASMRLSHFQHVENRGGRSSRGDFSSETVIWIDSDGFPLVDSQEYGATGVLWHYGGTLTWGPDSMVYLSLGDKQRADWAPMADKYSGCVLRLHANGTIPEGNLPPSVKPAECWAYGLRNGFKSFWDLQPTGQERFFIAEVGGNVNSRAHEDLHLGGPGKHFGWPLCEGPCSNNPTYTTCSCEIHDDPIYTYPHNNLGACLIGGFVYRGSQFPAEYNGAYFLSEYVHDKIQVLHFNADGGETVTSSEVFQHGSGKAISHLSEAPDGSMWYISDPDSANWNIRRVKYVAGSSAPIIHSLGPSAVSGPPPLDVIFTSHVVDLDSAVLQFTWEFGDGTTSNVTSPMHTFTTAGNYFVLLSVSDGISIIQSEFVNIEVGSPPVVTVVGMTTEQLATGINVYGGETLKFQASATDILDGDISSKLRWYDVFIHDGHTHPQGAEQQGMDYTVVVPISGHSFEGNTGLRLTVEAVNSRGLRHSVDIFLWPIRSALQIQSTPPGAPILVDGNVYPTPSEIYNMVWYMHTVTAGTTMCRGGIRYAFTYWNAPDHANDWRPSAVTTETTSFVILPKNSTVTAVYVPAGYCTVYRVNTGGDSVTDSSGNTWVGDRDPLQWAGTLVHSPGGRYVRPANHILYNPVLDAAQQGYSSVFQDERYTSFSDGEMQYAFAIERAGTYAVHITMMEGWREGVGSRIFDIILQDEVIYENVDVFAESGFQVPLVKTGRVTLTELGIITAAFLPKANLEGPSIFAIEVEMIGAAVPTAAPPPMTPTTRPPTTRMPTRAIATTTSPSARTPPPASVSPTPVAPILPPGRTVIHRINSGGPTFSDADDHKWVSDAPFTHSGSAIEPGLHVQMNYALTPTTASFAAVFETERSSNRDMGDITYSIPVDSIGVYEVEIICGESWHRNAGIRLFDIKVQGETSFAAVDLLVEYGFQQPVVMMVPVFVDASLMLEITFSPLSTALEGPTLSALRITSMGRVAPTIAPTVIVVPPSPATGSTLYRINCGGPSMIDEYGGRWMGDNALGYDVGGETVRPADYMVMNLVSTPFTRPLSNLLQTERWSKESVGDIEYVFRITHPGEYTVHILFVESWHQRAGIRVFNVDMQGQPVFQNVDLFAEYGYQTPAEKVAAITISDADEDLRVRFRPTTSPEGPAVYAIRVVHQPTAPSSAPPTPTPNEIPTTSTPAPPLVAPTPPPSPPMPTDVEELPFVVARLNCGGNEFVDAQGRSWVSDASLEPGGSTVRPSDHVPVAYTLTPETAEFATIFETERFSTMDTGPLRYTIPVGSSGLYAVELLFGESWHHSAAVRKFDIAVQDVVIVGSMSVVAEAGFQHPLIKTVTARVDSDLSVTVELLPVSSAPEGPTLSALRVTKISALPPSTPTSESVYRVNCGGSTVEDVEGNVWVGDNTLDYAVGGNMIRPGDYQSVTLAPSPYTVPLAVVLAEERWSTLAIGDIEYVFAVPPGEYVVKMLFAEVWHRDAGTRLFHIDVQDNRVFQNVDLITEYGFQTPAEKVAFVIVAADESEIRLTFRASALGKEGPAVYAISIERNLATRRTRREVDSRAVGVPTPTLSGGTYLLLSVTSGVGATLLLLVGLSVAVHTAGRKASAAEATTKLYIDIDLHEAEATEPQESVRVPATGVLGHGVDSNDLDSRSL